MRPKLHHLIAPIAAMTFVVLEFTAVASAQKAIGAKSGVIQFATGDVFLDGMPIRLAKNDYIQIENSQNLQTTNGSLELVLAPAAYLWLGQHSSLRMRQNKLNDIQVEINQGSAIVEILETIKYFPINVYVSKSVVELKKTGLYRLDAVPGKLRVYSGIVLAKNGKKQTRITKGRMISLDSESAPASFDVKSTDDLHRLATNRSAVVRKKQNEIEAVMRAAIRDLINFDLQSQADEAIQQIQAIQSQQQENTRLQEEQERRRLEYQAWQNQQQNQQQQQQPQK